MTKQTQFKILDQSIRSVGGFAVYFEDMEDIVIEWMNGIEEQHCPELNRMIKELDEDTVKISFTTITNWLILNKHSIISELHSR